MSNKNMEIFSERLVIYLVIIEKNQKTFFYFWEIGEVPKAAIFCLGRREQVEVSPDSKGPPGRVRKS